MSPAALRVLAAVFALVTVFEVLSFRSLIWTVEPDHDVIQKAVFERDEGNVVARAVPWHYPMRPQPLAFDQRIFQVPPGYPMLLRSGENAIDGFDLRLYETPAVALLMVRPAGAQQFSLLTLEPNGAGVLSAVGREPPPIAKSKALSACFNETEADPNFVPIYKFAHRDGMLTVEAGRCRWSLATLSAEILVSAQASSRLEMTGSRDVGETSLAWLTLFLVGCGSLISRFAMFTPAFVLTDVAATLFVFLVSFFSPLWLIIWGLKSCLGLAFGVLRALQSVRGSRRAQGILAAAITLAAALIFFVDPVRAAGWYTSLMADLQIEAMQSVDDRVETEIAEPSHLVLGYSTVNAAAAGRGAYGSAALDQVLQRTCGEGRRFTRHGTDGANICMMAKTWNEVSRAEPNLQQRIFVGGFNDDIAPSLQSLKALLPGFLAMVPAADPFPSVETAWHKTADANVNLPDRLDQALSCLRQVAAQGGTSNLIYVYDMGVFDLGAPRAHGRTAWVEHRRGTVEEAGGTFVDLRDLWPGESITLFNDFVHPSEIGYELMAQGLCERMQDAPATEPAQADREEMPPPPIDRNASPQ